MKKLLLLLALPTLFFCGCASDPLAAAKKHDVHTVAVERRVEAPPMRYGKLDESTANNEIADIIVDALNRKEINRMTIFQHNNDINVLEMVRTNFISAAQNLGFTFAQTNADAVFVVRVDQYGFESALFKHGVFPFAVVAAELRNPEGKVYWRGRASASGTFVRDMGSTWAEYEKDPQKLRADWKAIIDAATKNVLSASKQRNQLLFGEFAK